MKLGFPQFLFALTLTPLVAYAAAPDLSDMMSPGLWEMTVNIQMKGMPMSMPAQTMRRCVTKVALEENQGIPKPQTQGNVTCKTTRMERSGNTVNWITACTGQGDMEMDGTVAFDSPEAYHSTVHMTGTMQGRHIQMTQTMQGRRLGECHE